MAALVDDVEMGRCLTQITARNPGQHTKEWWAHSMMKWFSQAFTMGTNRHGDEFERDSDVRPYRYRKANVIALHLIRHPDASSGAEG